jgi:hypothetical protein
MASSDTLRDQIAQVVIDVEYDPGRGNLPADMDELIDALVGLIEQREALREEGL